MADSEALLDRRNSSNLTTALIIGYVRDRRGDGGVEQLLEVAGEARPIDELLDEARWSSFEQKIRLFEAAIEVLGDPDTPRLVGTTVLDRQVGAGIRLMLRALGSPASVCRSVAKASAKFSTNYTCEAVSVSREAAVISNRLHEGYEPNAIDCEYTKGLLSQIPVLFGLQPAVIVHEECQVRGAPACIYGLRWRARRRWPWGRHRDRISYLEEERALLTERYEALQSTIVDLVSPADVDTVLRNITSRAADAVRAHRFVLALKGDSDGVVVHHDGMSTEDAYAVASEVLAEVPDDRGGSRLIVDVASSRRSYGRLVAVYDFEHIFFPDERRLFAAYARQAAVALDAATALDEARRRGETASALLELSRQLAQATSTEEVAQRLAEAVLTVIGGNRSSVFLWDQASGQLQFQARASNDGKEPSIAGHYSVSMSDTPVLGEMLRTRRPQHVHRNTADTFLREHLEAIDAEEMLAVPIQSRGELLGAIAAMRSSSLPAAVDRKALADRFSGIADQAALAFEKVRLLEQERDAVRQLRRNELRIRHMAYHDALTELPNRRHFAESLQSCLDQARADGRQLAVFFCDIDRFKNVNDSLGHAKGDKVLKAAADRLRTCVRSTDTLARLGGDEFTVLVRDVSGPEEAATMAERILAALHDPFYLEGQELFLSASVGVAVYPDDGEDAQTLLKNADTAMYGAKLAGRDSQLRYAPAMNARAGQLLELEADLHEAVRNHEFVVHYQPQLSTATGEILGVEALVRWVHPRRGLVPAEDFVPVAEDRGLIKAIDTHVLFEAAAQCRRWEVAGFPPVRVAVNLSAHQFRDEGLLEMVSGVIGETGVNPDLIELELTETAALHDPDRVAHILRRLREVGVGLTLDDFGTGYSSWMHLKHFPIGRLKVDGSFVAGLPRDSQDAAIVSAMIEMAHILGLSVTAEGVETTPQAEFLTVHGCDLLQGYLYSEAKPGEEVTELLKTVASGAAR